MWKKHRLHCLVSAISSFDLIVDLQEGGGGYVLYFVVVYICLYSEIMGFATVKALILVKENAHTALELLLLLL